MASAIAASTSQAAEGRGNNVYLEMKHYQLTQQPGRTEQQADRFSARFVSARSAVRAEKLIGGFTNHIGMEAPYVLVLTHRRRARRVSDRVGQAGGR